MKIRDLKPLLVGAWDKWLTTQAIDPGEATGRDTLKFYLELLDARSPLLKFSSKGRDKWQIVHSWLVSERRVDLGG
jgi:hypothetical protein